MNKKTLIITVGSIILILIGLGIYFYLSQKTTTPSLGGTFPEEGPLGTIKPASEGSGEGSNIPFTPGSGAPLPRLYELHKVPVAGAGFIESGKDTDRIVSARYIERGLGHIYETPLSTFIESRISNETHSQKT